MAVRSGLVGATSGAALTALALQAIVPQIESFEGTRQRAYRDIVGVLTVCSGHTGPDVVVGKQYTTDECHALTLKDAEKAAKGVLAVSPHLIYHPMQLAAAISLSFNVGTGNYATSSVARNFNQGNFIAGCNSILLYNKAGGKFVQGLANRRAVEHTLCMSTLTSAGLKDVSAPI